MIKTADYKATALFCVIDDFCQHFEAENAGKLLLGEDGVRRRRRKVSYINEDATLYEGVHVEKPKYHSFHPYLIYKGENTLAEVAACCRKINERGIDITTSYDDWLKVGCVLATLGENGRSLFHICSQQNAKYNTAKTDKMFTDLLRINYQQVNIGTFFWMCKQHGITTNE